MTGLTCAVRSSSRAITSEASAEPPGESMRTTMARTRASSRARWMAAISVCMPTNFMPNSGIVADLPSMMSPSTKSTATAGRSQSLSRSGA